MLWRATSKQQKMLPVLLHAQLIHADNSLKLNGRHIRFLNLYLSLLIICLCVGAHAHKRRRTSINIQCMCVCVRIYGLEVKYQKRLIHPCSILKKLELQRTIKTTIPKCTLTYKCLKMFPIPIFRYSIYFSILEKNPKS